MFKKKTTEIKNKDEYNLALKYKKILDNAKELPEGSKEMFKAIRKAGLNDKA